MSETVTAMGVKLWPQHQRILDALRMAGAAGLTSMQLIQQAQVCKYTNRVSELKAFGYQITCTSEGKTLSGAKLFRYRIEGGSR